MFTGLNYPWMNYGWDFGVPPPGWRAIDSWRADLADQLPRWRELGINIVRWFILADGLSLAPPDTNDGLVWRMDEIAPLSQPLLDDFECMLGYFSPDLQVMPVVFDFPVAFPGLARRTADSVADIWRTGPRRPGLPHGFVKGGRADIVRNPRISMQFLERVLAPLLERSRPYRSHVFAWEVINEPEWIVQGALLGRRWHGLPEHLKVSPESMTEFLRMALGLIEAEGFRSTIGFTNARMLSAWHARLSPFLSEGSGYLPQFHYYPRKDEPLPQALGPLVLGEFSTSRDDSENPHAADWPDLGPQEQSLEKRLALLSARGYLAAFPWSYRARDAASGAWEETLTGLARYRSQDL
jgi:hypothetical protein